MIVDRKNGPKIKVIDQLNIPKVNKEFLPNGIELVEVNMGTQNLVQLEVLYKGGRINEKKKGASRATARLIKEGTGKYKGAEIAEEFDFYGANITSGASLDYSYVKVFSLNKYFHKILPILKEVLFSPSFPKDELEKYKKNSIQKIQIEKAKSELVAYRAITEKMYGADHPYGYNSTEQVYKDLVREDLIEYYEESYGTDNCILLLSGKITPEIKKDVVDVFGKRPRKEVNISYKSPELIVPNDKSETIRVSDTPQTAIKIGCRLFRRDHPDFKDMFILNTLLGGYFGSRLMSSLREEKGYTYNIYSSIDMMIHDGYFNISTEVGNEYVGATIEGIYEEMNILMANEVGADELNMVKNYLSGNFLNMVDGPFKVAGMSKVVALNGLEFDFYQNLMKRIHTITSENLKSLAQKYFGKEKMVEIIVGNP